IGLAFLFFNLLASIRAKVQLNWPAPAYFTLSILTAYFLSTRLKNLQSWKPWRGWFYAAILIGLIVVPISHDNSILFPIIKRFVDSRNKATAKKGKPPKYSVADFDLLDRLRGWRMLGNDVSEKLQSLGPGAFVLCDDYQQTAEMAFYVVGQPKTYCAGPYFGKRLSQYDMWPDRKLDSSSPLLGRDAIYVGKGGALPEEVANAFARVEKLPLLPVQVDGAQVRTFKTWRCFGFKGMQRSQEMPDY
ncbi:MAG TPA: hypothetical protein VKK61_09480, partial [Tepidisphaeraceae bacterium]|nr:hypothetical protein [Tepidisphaeraceae bacterium]